MKKLLVLLATVLPTLTVGSISQAQSFVHPGIPLTKPDLDLIKANLNIEPWKSGYEALASDSRSQLSYTMQGPFASVSRAPHINRNQWMNDMTAAYNLARMWYFTGNSSYAQKSHDILLAWANTQTSFSGGEAHLDLGDQAYRYVGGADILRGTWSGWTQADTNAVKALFQNVYWPSSMGTDKDMLGPANKGMLSLVAGAAIAAFNDDTTRFNQVLNLYQTSASAALPNTTSNGQVGETARDQGHAYGQWLSMAMLSEIFWKQGVDVYSLKDNRLLAIGEYFSRFNLGADTPYVPFGTTDYLYINPPTSPWANGRTGMNLLNGAYLLRKGLSSPQMELRRQSLPIDMDNFVYEKPADSSTAIAATPVTFPASSAVSTGLTNLDVGTATPAGSGTYSNGIWTVKGGGSDIWTHGSDSFHFTYKEVAGDCAIIARVNSVDATSANAKAGVMIRQTSSADSMKAWVAITSSQNAEFFMSDWTEVYGGTNWEKNSRAIPNIPYWVKVERVGNIISLYTSPDGASWAAIGAGKFANMGSTALLGLCVCSTNNGTLNTAIFSHVRITSGDNGGTNPIPFAPLTLLASSGGSQVPLRWSESFGATSYRVKRALASGGPYTNIATVSAPSYVDKSVSGNMPYYYVISAVNASGESGNSPQESVTPVLPAENLVGVGTGSASNGTSGAQGADKAFDQNVGTKWYSGSATGTTGWLQYDFGSPRSIQSYSLVSANDVQGRDPKDWQLLGSNNGTTWTTLDTRSGQTFGERWQTLDYPLSLSTGYRYYRLNIIAIADATANSIQLAELILWGQPATAFAQKSVAEGAGAAFDGSVDTKWYSGDNAGTGGWLQYDFGTGNSRVVLSYTLTSANDVAGRDPKDWQLQASNDGTTWTTLDTRTGQTFASRKQTKSYSISSNTAYRIYRLNVTAIATSSAKAIQLAEFTIKNWAY